MAGCCGTGNCPECAQYIPKLEAQYLRPHLIGVDMTIPAAVDWEGLKAAGPFMRRELLSDAWPEILAQHEADQRVIEAAEKLAAAVVAKVTPHNYQAVVAEALAEYDKAKQS